MPTVTNSIGSAGRNYSTIALWLAALPANLVTDGNSYTGQCYNDSEFVETNTISGHTTDATHVITLTTAPGQSFHDNSDVQGNKLVYDHTNGVGIKGTTVSRPLLISDNNVFLSNLQILQSSTYYNSVAITSGSCVIDYCLLQSNGSHGVLSAPLGNIVRNTVLYATASGITQVAGDLLGSDVGGPSFYFCTFVAPNNVTPPSEAVYWNYSSVYFENCAFFGAAAVKAGAASMTFVNCMTDVASPPSG